MPTKILVLAGVAAFLCIIASETLCAQTPATAISSAEVAKIEAQEFSRSLAQLKIQEVALARAVPLDEKALDLNRAQQSALEQELTKLALEPMKLELRRLESEKQAFAVDLRPAHPKMVVLQNMIEHTKAAMAANR